MTAKTELVSATENRRLQDEMIVNVFVANPFVRHLGLALESRNDAGVTVRMPFLAELCNKYGTHHGGAVASLIDTVAATAVWDTNDFNRTRSLSTTSLTVQYLGVAPGQDLLATARTSKRGRDVAFIEITVVGEKGPAVASALATFRVTP